MIAPRPSTFEFTTAGFRTSTYTNGSGQCVEVADLPGWTAVRDTKNRTGGTITIPRTAWTRFLRAATSNRTSFDA